MMIVKRAPRSIHLVMGLAMVLTACGGSNGSTHAPRFTAGSDGNTPQAEVTPKTFVAAVGSPTDRTVTLAPLTYSDPASPCTGMQATTTLANANAASADCAAAWVNLRADKVPGNDLMAAATTPKQAQVAAGLDLPNATAAANAFYEAAALQRFAYQDNNRTLITALDTEQYLGNDLVFTELTRNAGTTQAVPDCYLPTSIRVVPVPADVNGYLASLGWPSPSSTAIVANYSACAGITFLYPTHTTKTLFGQTTPGAAVITGHIENIAPFGDLWITDGYGICGEPQLKAVCGV